MAKDSNNGLLDRMGIWISSLCALHCLLLPILLPVVPLIGATIFAEAWFERSILTLSMIIGLWALFVGFHRYHRQIYPVYSLILGGLLYWNKDAFGHDFEPVLVVLGACLIIVAHVMNYRLCQSCKSCATS